VQAASAEKKRPADAVWNLVHEPLQHAGRQDCFRRPVKVSAAIAAYVPVSHYSRSGLELRITNSAGQNLFITTSKERDIEYAPSMPVTSFIQNGFSAGSAEQIGIPNDLQNWQA